MAGEILFGFRNLQDVKNERVTEANVDVVQDAIDKTIVEHNRQLNALIALFCRRTTKFKEMYNSEFALRLQGLDDDGRATAVKIGGRYEVAWPIHAAGLAWGGNRITLLKQKIGDVERLLRTMMVGDKRWIRDHILAALFASANWTHTDDEHGDLIIKPLANGDADKYLIQRGADQGGTDSHLLGHNAAVADATNPFKTVYNELIEHPENGDTVIAFIPEALTDETEGLTKFRESEDPDVQAGANRDKLVGSLDARVPGEVKGKVGKVWIVEWDAIPDDVIVGVTVGGGEPLAMREDELEELQGFQKVAERQDAPFKELQFERRAGFGSNNRVGAVCLKVGAANWATPAGYESPMP